MTRPTLFGKPGTLRAGFYVWQIGRGKKRIRVAVQQSQASGSCSVCVALLDRSWSAERTSPVAAAAWAETTLRALGVREVGS